MIKSKIKRLKKYSVFEILIDGVKDFGKNDSFTFAASTAFYTIFSLPALLIIILNIASVILNEETVKEELLAQVSKMMGSESAATLEDVMSNVSVTGQTMYARIIGIGVLVFSATTVFVSLQNSINHIWHIRSKPEKGFLKFLMNRFLSFSMVASIGFLLLVSLLADAFIVILLNYFSGIFENSTLRWASVINFLVTQSIFVLVFGLMYKILPDAKVKWKDVWLGAFVTMLLFGLGKYLIGLYIGNADVGSYYGTAGSLVVVLIWVYYSVLIFLFGAQLTYYIAENIGGHVTPIKEAVKVKIIEIEEESDEENEASEK
ncbi:YihY/virulence factor BrkB family protein [Cyclobacterium marinum]|uniref:Ribonuclease BN n=1 Tax=Cyclobacterium marinum (strain ATCC 25205 / DSM 745 / LMG 13164 / NCIMB 1802) TaxID=880070 RepID=G0J333_CYCMS|nr:YihY/virulence factor BrkB family protein [Cyclobacterium marinum]AEL28329.1 ribonuclease BN [Cyclobacterium marinum DSM 745]MBI0398185.1 YihY/virulence factor BrkB family protein [Cyclobacterium marinum]MBR9777002.1 YihY/virulence factor BrkB family protein [Cytophagales bacterium]|tara:strand:+ start:14942 stop:15895 length:954 start_codon:yes stop_codon:yes gene_type:complete